MISYLTRKELNVKKYDQCIDKSLNSRIYAYSWYLDCVADNWDVLVLDDYKAVMPLPWREKFFIKYVYPPFWLLELGIFFTSDDIDEKKFLNKSFKHFKFIELRMNTGNLHKNSAKFGQLKQLQYLSLKDGYKVVKNGFRKDRHKDLRKAAEHSLTERSNDNPEKLVQLFKENVGKRIPNIKESDYKVLVNLIKTCIDKKLGEIISVYDINNQLTASAFLLKHQSTVTILVSSTDFNNRNNGANTFLIDRAIFNYCKDFDRFNFGGSSMKSIADYFKSYGAVEEEYCHYKRYWFWM